MIMMDFTNPNDFWSHQDYNPYKGMSDDERMKAGCLQLASYIVMILFGLLLCALFGSCTTMKYVLVPEYHTDTLRISHNTHDSIYVHDSTYIKEAGDTVLIEKWHTQWRDRIVHDTIYQSKRDSIPYPVEVIKEVPAELTMWELLKMKAGGIAILLCIFAFLFWIWRSK